MDIVFNWLGITSDYLKAALLSGIFQFTGALIAALVAIQLFIREKRQQRKRDELLNKRKLANAANERLVKTHDLATAIRAEISVNYVQEENLRQQLSTFVASNETAFMLFTNPGNFVFTTLKDDILLFPRDVIDAVVKYYKLEELLANILLQVSEGKQQQPDHKRRQILLINDLAQKLQLTAQTAFAVLSNFIGDNERATLSLEMHIRPNIN